MPHFLLNGMLQTAGFVAPPVSGHLSDRMGRANHHGEHGAGGRSRAFALLVVVLGFFLFATPPVLQVKLLESIPRRSKCGRGRNSCRSGSGPGSEHAVC
jgi:MFS family permease